eukprot:scaffold16494_cov83-Cyclotella_meneghiniana.AAC.14
MSQSALPMPPQPQQISPSYVSDTETTKQINNGDTAVLNDCFELEAEALSPQLEVTKAELVKATETNARDMLKSLRTEKDSSAQILAEMTSKINELEEQHKQLQKESDQLVSAVTKANAMLEESNKQNQALSESNSDKDQKLSKLSTSLHLSEDKLSAVTNENSSLKIEVGKLQHNINELEEKCKHVQRERHELQSRNASETAALQAELSAVKTTNATLEGSKEHLKQLNKVLSESNSDKERKLTKLSTSLHLSEDKLSAVTNENASLKLDVSKWQHIFNELDKKYKHLNRERDELKERLDVAIKMGYHAMDLQKKVEEHEEEIKQLKADKGDHQKALQAELESKEAELDSAEAELDSKKAEIVGHKKMKEDLN